MYKKIMAAIDGSDTSKRAFDEAMSFARSQDALLHVVYVVDSPAMLYGVGFYDPAELKKAFVEEGALLAREAEESMQAAGVRGDTAIVDAQGANGDVVHALAQEADRWGADLVVLGTHGRRGMQRALLGSVAEEFMRVTPVPVLLVRYAADE
ncbi:universal stress protein [Robbsia andropogonis]|uniref:universal stress protein n=1 Tax=Robbsia andropogonis TaxID=28092 RepID=UPI00209F5BBD|nr:universal stress protein [Robbsia andropogonis]MCP1116821.1 universal stress protein [Robbsia andropogonis]MCP1126500.1 universal stress protein [Robbsia andropogonis]